MAILLLIIILFISFIFIYKYGFTGVAAAFMLCGSVTDSAGILYGINSIFPYYKLLIWILSFFCFFITLIVLRKEGNKKFINWYYIPFVLSIFFIFISVAYQGLDSAYFSSAILFSGIPFFCMWVVGRRKKGRENALFYLLLAHGIISLIVILGKSHLNLINGFSYVYRIDANAIFSDYSSLINNDLSLFSLDKYEVQKTAQFHNSNALGFFSSVLIASGLALCFKYIKLYRANSSKNLGIALLTLGLVLWLNSLTRGPIIFILLVFAYIYTRSWKIFKNFLIYFILFVVVVIVALNYSYDFTFFNFLIPSEDNVSVTSRFLGYIEGYHALKNNLLLGNHYEGFPPHIYFFKIMAYHGLPAGILIAIPIFHVAIQSFKKFRKDLKEKSIRESTFVLLLVGCLLGVYLTNGTVSYVLFGILLAEACIRNKVFVSKNDMDR